MSSLTVSESLGKHRALSVLENKDLKKGRETGTSSRSQTGRGLSLRMDQVCGLAWENLRSDTQQCCVKGPRGNRDEQRAAALHQGLS